MRLPGDFGTLYQGGIGLPNGGLNVIINAIVAIINMSLVLAIVLAFIYLLIGGIKWITSSGDKQGLANAKSTVTYAIIGLILAFLSFAIIGFVSTFFQVDLGVGFTHSGSYIPKGVFKE